MIACCAPSNEQIEESLSTLHYATRARHIQNKPAVRIKNEAKVRTGMVMVMVMVMVMMMVAMKGLGMGWTSRKDE